MNDCPFALLAAKILGGVSIALLLFSVVAWNKWHDWKETARIWHMAFDTQKSAYNAAQSAAKVKLDAQRKVLKNDYDIIAERSDNARQKVNDLIAASEQFARNNRVPRKASAAVGAAGRTAAAGQGNDPARDSGPGADSVVVPIDDFNVLVGNTGRLIQANDWFKELEAKGLAEAAPEGR